MPNISTNVSDIDTNDNQNIEFDELSLRIDAVNKINENEQVEYFNKLSISILDNIRTDEFEFSVFDKVQENIIHKLADEEDVPEEDIKILQLFINIETLKRGDLDVIKIDWEMKTEVLLKIFSEDVTLKKQTSTVQNIVGKKENIDKGTAQNQYSEEEIIAIQTRWKLFNPDLQINGKIDGRWIYFYGWNEIIDWETWYYIALAELMTLYPSRNIDRTLLWKSVNEQHEIISKFYSVFGKMRMSGPHFIWLRKENLQYMEIQLHNLWITLLWGNRKDIDEITTSIINQHETNKNENEKLYRTDFYGFLKAAKDEKNKKIKIENYEKAMAQCNKTWYGISRKQTETYQEIVFFQAFDEFGSWDGLTNELKTIFGDNGKIYFEEREKSKEAEEKRLEKIMIRKGQLQCIYDISSVFHNYISIQLSSIKTTPTIDQLFTKMWTEIWKLSKMMESEESLFASKNAEINEIVNKIYGNNGYIKQIFTNIDGVKPGKYSNIFKGNLKEVTDDYRESFIIKNSDITKQNKNWEEIKDVFFVRLRTDLDFTDEILYTQLQTGNLIFEQLKWNLTEIAVTTDLNWKAFNKEFQWNYPNLSQNLWSLDAFLTWLLDTDSTEYENIINALSKAKNSKGKYDYSQLNIVVNILKKNFINLEKNWEDPDKLYYELAMEMCEWYVGLRSYFFGKSDEIKKDIKESYKEEISKNLKATIKIQSEIIDKLDWMSRSDPNIWIYQTTLLSLNDSINFWEWIKNWEIKKDKNGNEIGIDMYVAERFELQKKLTIMSLFEWTIGKYIITSPVCKDEINQIANIPDWERNLQERRVGLVANIFWWWRLRSDNTYNTMVQTSKMIIQQVPIMAISGGLWSIASASMIWLLARIPALSAQATKLILLARTWAWFFKLVKTAPLLFPLWIWAEWVVFHIWTVVLNGRMDWQSRDEIRNQLDPSQRPKYDEEWNEIWKTVFGEDYLRSTAFLWVMRMFGPITKALKIPKTAWDGFKVNMQSLWSELVTIWPELATMLATEEVLNLTFDWKIKELELGWILDTLTMIIALRLAHSPLSFTNWIKNNIDAKTIENAKKNLNENGSGIYIIDANPQLPIFMIKWKNGEWFLYVWNKVKKIELKEGDRVWNGDYTNIKKTALDMLPENLQTNQINLLSEKKIYIEKNAKLMTENPEWAFIKIIKEKPEFQDILKKDWIKTLIETVHSKWKLFDKNQKWLHTRELRKQLKKKGVENDKIREFIEYMTDNGYLGNDYMDKIDFDNKKQLINYLKKNNLTIDQILETSWASLMFDLWLKSVTIWIKDW